MDAYVIQLKTEIKNPSPDRRSKDWHKYPLVKADTRFIVQNDVTIMASNQRYAFVHVNSDVGKLIMANSERVEPESIRELLVVDADCETDNADLVLRALVGMGRVSRQDLRDARDFLNAEYEAREAESA